jgi:hypothetical protein
MIDALLRLALDEKSELHRIVSLLLKILLTLMVSIMLYGWWLGKEWLQHLPNVEQFIRWIETGEILIGIGLYFVVWYSFYEVLWFLFQIGPVRWVGNIIDNYFKAVLLEFKTATAEDVMKVKVFLFFKRSGIITTAGDKIQPGWRVLEIANVLKKSEDQKEEKQVFAPYTNPCLAIQFVVTVLMVKSLWLLPLWILLFGAVIIVFIIGWGVISLVVRNVFSKYRYQLISLAEQSNEMK